MTSAAGACHCDRHPKGFVPDFPALVTIGSAAAAQVNGTRKFRQLESGLEA